MKRYAKGTKLFGICTNNKFNVLGYTYDDNLVTDDPEDKEKVNIWDAENVDKFLTDKAPKKNLREIFEDMVDMINDDDGYACNGGCYLFRCAECEASWNYAVIEATIEDITCVKL